MDALFHGRRYDGNPVCQSSFFFTFDLDALKDIEFLEKNGSFDNQITTIKWLLFLFLLFEYQSIRISYVLQEVDDAFGCQANPRIDERIFRNST